MTTVPTVDTEMEVVPEAGHRGVDTRDDFVTKQENYQDAQRIKFQPQLESIRSEVNTSIGAMNTLAGEINTLATQTKENADIAKSLAHYEGLWSSLTGALSKPASVKHNNRFWALNVDLADVTLSEPSTTNSDWALVTTVFIDTDVTVANDGDTIVPFTRYRVDASGGAFTLNFDGTYAAGDRIKVIGIDAETLNATFDNGVNNIVSRVSTESTFILDENLIEFTFECIDGTNWRVY